MVLLSHLHACSMSVHCMNDTMEAVLMIAQRTIVSQSAMTITSPAFVFMSNATALLQ
jgi:hypothetical protein